jgi:CheY-like chemotaxis protein/phosphoribosyl 1,2-cyclic phosphodiesterase
VALAATLTRVRIRFWGTRGSIAKPGPSTLRHGGNTSCVEVRTADGTLIVLDCGTGAHELGRHLVKSSTSPIRGHLFITHTHWDHIQGFPFFAPLFTAGNEWDVYAPEGVGQRLEATLAGQMEYTYFPIGLGHLDATLRFHDLREGSFDAGGARVTARYLNHPGLTLGYRLEADGATVVYATDHEPHSRHHAGAPIHPEDQRHVDFLAGADLVIHDAQYTLEEYPSKLTWGHSPAELTVDWALAAGARRLALFHHDPMRDDAAVDRLLAGCRERAAGRGGLEVFAAAEGGVIELAPSPGGARAPGVTAAGSTRALAAPPGATVLVVDDDPEVVKVVALILEPEGFRVVSAADGPSGLARARAERPDLVLLDVSLPGASGLDVCRALRAADDPHLRTVPVVMVSGFSAAQDTAAGFAAGATDFLAKPFKPAHVLSRIQAWLLRVHGNR